MSESSVTSKRPVSPAMKFLWVIAALTVLAILLAVLYRLFEPQITRWALVPGHSVLEDERPLPLDYGKAGSWAARPGLKGPALEAPQGFRAAPNPSIAVFFVHPTTYISRKHWNGGFDDAETNRRIDQSLRHQASPFNGIGAVWAPRYRQATFGAFLVPERPDAQRALLLAYGDVQRAFDAFIAAVPADQPIILAGHSQGAYHLRNLLKDRVAGTPLQRRLVAAYVIGWPIGIAGDLPALGGIGACGSPMATGCIVSWQSFGSARGALALRQAFAAAPGLTGRPLGMGPLVCVNPITYWADRRGASARANLGALEYFPAGKPLGAVRPGLAGAVCTSDGLLMLEPPPGAPFTAFKLPGENYHIYDINLFWANLRANAEARGNAFVMPATP